MSNLQEMTFKKIVERAFNEMVRLRVFSKHVPGKLEDQMDGIAANFAFVISGVILDEQERIKQEKERAAQVQSASAESPPAEPE